MRIKLNKLKKVKKRHKLWTHGINWNHTLANCRNKAEGHKDDATKKNSMGGNQFGTK